MNSSYVNSEDAVERELAAMPLPQLSFLGKQRILLAMEAAEEAERAEDERLAALDAGFGFRHGLLAFAAMFLVMAGVRLSLNPAAIPVESVSPEFAPEVSQPIAICMTQMSFQSTSPSTNLNRNLR